MYVCVYIYIYFLDRKKVGNRCGERCVHLEYEFGLISTRLQDDMLEYYYVNLIDNLGSILTKPSDRQPLFDFG
jgi:hypothetical protein